jgi:hypothetical protein
VPSSTLAPPPATQSTFACNPAHSYPAGVSCISTNGALTLVYPSTSATGTASPAVSTGAITSAAGSSVAQQTTTAAATTVAPYTGGAENMKVASGLVGVAALIGAVLI